jgi:hypothetical protein
MRTPIDSLLDGIAEARYHDHRSSQHARHICGQVAGGLESRCNALRDHLEAGLATMDPWSTLPGKRGGRGLLVAGAQQAQAVPIPRVWVQATSVITAHRNASNRFDELRDTLSYLQGLPRTPIAGAVVLVGTAERVLNVTDRLKPMYRSLDRLSHFEAEILPRLSSGDSQLWGEFPWAVSENRSSDAMATFQLFRGLGQSKNDNEAPTNHILTVPVHIDNVNPPYVDEAFLGGARLDELYGEMLTRLASAYDEQWT